jgi:hypothetical protein
MRACNLTKDNVDHPPCLVSFIMYIDESNNNLQKLYKDLLEFNEEVSDNDDSLKRHVDIFLHNLKVELVYFSKENNNSVELLSYHLEISYETKNNVYEDINVNTHMVVFYLLNAYFN